MNAFAFFKDGNIKRVLRWETKPPSSFERHFVGCTDDVKYFSLLDGNYVFTAYLPFEALAGVKSSYINSAFKPSHGFFKWDENYGCWTVANMYE